MLDLGRIEPLPNSSGIDAARWQALIDSHRSLGHIPPYVSIKPGTQEYCEYRAPVSSAIIHIDGIRVGSIYWALYDSALLFVEAQADSAHAVVKIAEEIAMTLGARFVFETDDGELSPRLNEEAP